MFRSTIWGSLLLLGISTVLLNAHEGHQHLTEETFTDIKGWLGAIGRLHFLMVHFPIALIVMTVVAEWLWIWYKHPLFSNAARFMILTAAIMVVPTVLFGMALGYTQSYEGISLSLYTWHYYLGFITAGLTILTAILREWYVKQYHTPLIGYYISLLLLFVFLNLTGTFGGGLAFGLEI